MNFNVYGSPKSEQSIKNWPKITLVGVSGGAWELLAAKIEKTRSARELLGPPGALLAPSWRPLGAVLALRSPSWVVLGRLGALLSPLKIDVKIDQEIDACQDRFLHQFSSIFASKMQPNYHQDGIKNRSYLGLSEKEKTTVKQMNFNEF